MCRYFLFGAMAASQNLFWDYKPHIIHFFIDTLYATALRNPGKMTIVFTSHELLKTVHNKKLAAMIGVEGGHMIENDLNKLDSLYKRGARYMTLTWNNSTPWATSAMEETRD